MRAATCFFVAFALALGVTTAQDASAYCRSSTCRETQICDGEEPFDPGCKPLQWKRSCIGVSVQVDASIQASFDVANALVTKAFATWEEPTCDDATGGKPNIHVRNLGPVECNLVEYNSKGGNANIVTFRDDTWPHPSGPHNIALTTVTFDTRTGEIYDADMEINTALYTLTTTDAGVQYDLLSVLTHEAGHFLGLTHSFDTSATMWATYTAGSIGPRTISLDDIAGICSTYPPGEPIDKDACNPIPRHGFSPACLAKQTEGDCAVRGPLGASSKSESALVMLVLVALAKGRCFRRLRARQRSSAVR